MPNCDKGGHSAESNIVVRPLGKSDLDSLVKLFKIISNDPAITYFHPHPFTDEQAHKIVSYSGRDLYFGVFVRQEILGYGMLRGWDAGYEVPSLGIYLTPSARGKGLAKVIMDALHRQAHRVGSKKVRLKVYRDNAVAVRLYEQLGYKFESDDAGQVVGYIDLTTMTRKSANEL